MPKFSVVISVYNKEKYISNTLESVLNQTFQDFEIVILNDGSTDNSEMEILAFKDNRIRFFSEDNRGAGAGRNYVIKKAQGDYIALLDADDYWYPFYLEEQLRLITKYPEAYVFATSSEIKRKEKTFQRSYSINLKNKNDLKLNYFKASLLDSILHSSSTVLKKEVFENVGFYDPNIKSGQDTDLYVRIGLNYNIIFSPKVCVSYLIISNSLFHTTKKIVDKADFKVYEKFENENINLKIFLDLNRYSLCLLAKMEGNTKAFQENLNKINKDFLNKKQRFLLKQNKYTLALLFKTKKSLANLGIRLSSFK